MFDYFKSLPDILEIIIWIVILLAFLGCVIGVIYKIFSAEKIKIGAVEIDDENKEVKTDDKISEGK